MNWKRMLSEFLIYAGIDFTVFYLSGWKRQEPFFNSHNLNQSALVAIAVGLVIVGLRELGRGGHQEVRRFWGKFLMVWFAVFILVLVEAIKYHGAALPDSVLDTLLYLFLVPCIVPLALALYLNRKQSGSEPQQTSVNVS